MFVHYLYSNTPTTMTATTIKENGHKVYETLSKQRKGNSGFKKITMGVSVLNVNRGTFQVLGEPGRVLPGDTSVGWVDEGRGDQWEKCNNMIVSCQNGRKGGRLTVRTRQDCQKYKECLSIVKSSHCSTPIFRAGLFTGTNLWKQPKCPAMNEWVKS